MALVTKTIRCAVCGSSDVAFDGKDIASWDSENRLQTK